MGSNREDLPMSERREHILNSAIDLVGKLLYYDRMDDDELPVGAIEEVLAAGELEESDIVDAFAKELREKLAEGRLEKTTPLTTWGPDG